MRRLFTLLFLIFLPVQVAVAAPAPKEFGTLPAVYDAAISPDGNNIAMFYNVDGTYGLMIMPLNNKNAKPKSFMLGTGVKPRWLKWANDTHILASIWQSEQASRRAATGSNIRKEALVYTSSFIHSVDITTMKSDILVDSKRIFRQFNDHVIDFLNDDEDHILMSFSDYDVEAPDVQKVNVKTGKAKRIKSGSQRIQYWYTDLTGTPRIGQGLSDKSDKEKWQITIKDADSDTWRSHEDYPGLAPSADIYGFTSDPNELIIGRYNGKDTKGLYIYNLAEKRQTRALFHNDKYDVDDIVLSADGKNVVGASFVSDSDEIALFEDYNSALENVRKQLPGYDVKYVDQSRSGDIVLFKASNAYDPGGLFIVNSQTNDIKMVAPYRKGLPTDEMGVVIPVRYPARDGEKIPSYVTVPPSIQDTAQLKNIPFIVLPHGGPYARESKQFDYFAQFFATRGFGVLQMNFRGSSGYGKSFQEAGRKNWVVMQEDVEDGTRWLIEKGYADPDRICIAGWSYGGYAALMGAIKNPELYACSISMAGVTDLQDMIRDIKKYRFGRLSARNFVLRGFEDSDAIKENSPVRRAEEYTVPLFLAHGVKDQRVHYDQYVRMKGALRKSSAETTFMHFRDEDHFLSNQKNRQQFFVGLDKFLNETVGESEYKLK